jgi:hypothetical protein
VIQVEPIKGNHNLIGMWYMLSLPDGRADRVFYAAKHDLKYVLDWADQCDYIGGAFLDGQLIGIGFAENLMRYGETSRVEVGFGFLPNCNIMQALQAGRKILSHFFETLDVENAFGTTPEKNREALAYIKRLGLKLYGPVPNFCTYLGAVSGVYTSHITREEWKQLNKHNYKNS